MRSVFHVLTAAALVTAVTPPVAIGQTAIDARVDRFIEAARKERGMPAISIAVMKNGRLVHARGFGFANVEHQAPATPETIYQSGSVGKQFTATAVMMLVEAGKIALDSSVRRYLTDAPESWQPITIRHLLSHTSGLGDYPNDVDLRRDFTEDQLLEMVYRTPLLFPPGAKWAYSNLGFLTLGVLIHRVSGQFYGDFLAERVFGPLGMGTRIISESDIVPHRAAGYVLKDGRLKNQDWVSPTFNTTGDGALYFTVLDLAKWDAALRTERLLRRETQEQMWTPIRLNDGSTAGYGFGWSVRTTNGHRVVEHGGAWQGFLTHIVRYRDDGLSVVVLVNLAAPVSKPGELAHKIAALYLPSVAEPNGKP